MKIVLAYSGGLDTTVSISLLKEKFNATIITATINVGEEANPKEIEERAYKAGAEKHYYINAIEDFAETKIKPCIKMNCLYEDKYPMGTALARPLIAEKIVEIAKKEGADAIAHGSTSKGNDQVRFDLTVSALDPSLDIITPIRRWRLTRKWAIQYAITKNIPINTEHKKYSIDSNIWTRSIEGGQIDNPTLPPPEDAFEWTIAPEKAPDTPETITIEFEKGEPISINGEKKTLTEIITELNNIGGKHGYGRIDHIENRLVGIKSREVYEAPAALILIQAHKELEKTVYTPREYRFKKYLDQEWSDMVYMGLWQDPLRQLLQETGEKMNQWVTGTVQLKLYKGSLTIQARDSPYTLYDDKLADYNHGWYPTEEEARGFIKIWGLHMLQAIEKRKVKK